MKTRRIMMAVAMMLVCISSTAQEKRMMEFQVMMAMHDTNWKCDTTTDPDFFWAKPE